VAHNEVLAPEVFKKGDSFISHFFIMKWSVSVSGATMPPAIECANAVLLIKVRRQVSKQAATATHPTVKQH
jgi:hypothetical protein